MLNIGVDFGGTKIEAAVLDPEGRFLARRRAPNPGAYDAAIRTVRELVEGVRAETGADRRDAVGVGIPGSVNPRTGLIRNANTTWLNGACFGRDLGDALETHPVRLANDANCFVLSEATDGAGAGCASVFGVIIGTGCGGGLALDGRLVEGANGIAGEWGHTPLPWMTADEQRDAPECWCGRRGCLETWLSGPALAADHARETGETLTTREIVERSGAEPPCAATLDRYRDRLARALAMVADIFDPACIVLGGGLCNIERIRDDLPGQIARHAFCDAYSVRVARAMHGDSSGVRGAAWLWKTE